jgi:hypothetical protein
MSKKTESRITKSQAIRIVEADIQLQADSLCGLIDELKLRGITSTPDLLEELERVGRKQLSPAQFLLNCLERTKKLAAGDTISVVVRDVHPVSSLH